VRLTNAVPVELRYETIVVEDGKLHIYRDVYDQQTNTEENVRAVLDASGIRFDDLTEEERTQISNALIQMSGPGSAQTTPSPRGTPIGTRDANPSPSPGEKKSPATKTMPRATRNQKEIVIEIAALKGKGYPAPVDLDTGAGRKSK
jgi:L,D-transpeptidase ErfK/SrfK